LKDIILNLIVISSGGTKAVPEIEKSLPLLCTLTNLLH